MIVRPLSCSSIRVLCNNRATGAEALLSASVCKIGDILMETVAQQCSFFRKAPMAMNYFHTLNR
jgi:hypothetical protein